MATHHDEEVLGKAYDARLMRRLLTYLRPYRAQVAVALGAIVAHSALELAPPFLTKIVIDDYIPARDLSGLWLIAVLYLSSLLTTFGLEYLQTWTLQMAGQRIMFDIVERCSVVPSVRVASVARLTRGEEMQERVNALARTGMHDDEIAAVLTRVRSVILERERNADWVRQLGEGA